MIGSGTIVNTAAIVGGGFIGGFLKNGIPERYKNIIQQSIGLSVAVIGISGALQAMFSVSGGQIQKSYTMMMIFSLLIGGILGELLRIEDRLEHVGLWLQRRFKGDGGMAEGFVTATLLFCVGAMSIVGSLQDGLTGNASTLYAKSVLDGVMALVFASTLGFGVIFSAVSILVYEGSITLLAGVVKPWLTDQVITQISLVGGVLIIAIGINLLGIKKIKVGNLIPAVFIPFLYYLLTVLVKRM